MGMIYSMARSNIFYNVQYYYTATLYIYIYIYIYNSLHLITWELDFYFENATLWVNDKICWIISMVTHSYITLINV